MLRLSFLFVCLALLSIAVLNVHAYADKQSLVLAESDSSAAPNAFKSIERSSVKTIPTLDQSLWYSHGVGYGASGTFLKDPTWFCILSQLQPNVVKSLENQSLTQIQLNLENNPVIAAYVATRHVIKQGASILEPQNARSLLKLEWDLFVSANAPADLAQARIAHGKPLTLVIQNILRSIAVSTLFNEVKNAPSPLDWLEIFGRAVKIANANKNKLTSTSQCASLVTVPGDKVSDRKLAAQYLGKNGGLVIDVKAAYAKVPQINAFIDSLSAQYGINVVGVGSFLFDQLVGLKPSVTPVHFFHSVFGFLHKKDSVPKGGVVMFNAGSLFKLPKTTIDTALLTRLSKEQAAGGYRFGYYVQEPAASCQSMANLINFVKVNPALAQMGLAWGNVDGQCDAAVSGNGLGCQEGLFTFESKFWHAKNAVVSAVSTVKNWFTSSKTNAAPKVAAAPAQPQAPAKPLPPTIF